MEETCLCKSCSKKPTCGECEFCNKLTVGGHSRLIGCPDYDPIDEVNDDD